MNAPAYAKKFVIYGVSQIAELKYQGNRWLEKNTAVMATIMQEITNSELKSFELQTQHRKIILLQSDG